MKKVLLLLAVMLFARENPFELPKSSSASKSAAVEQAKPKKSVAAPVQPQKATSSESSAKQVPAKDAPSVAPSDGMQKVAGFGFLSIYVKDNLLKVETRDAVRRTFTIDKPKKAVFDFAAKRRFSSKTISLNKGVFKKVSIGAHKKFYRVAIEVEKGCKPKINDLELLCQ